MSVSAITGVSTSQTIYPIMVNGYLCFDAAEVAEARNFVNPNASTTAKTTTATTTTTTQTATTGQTSKSVYPTMVNGYLCFSAAQVMAARSFINPFAGTTGVGVPIRTTTVLATYTANASTLPTATRGTAVNLFV